MLDEKTRKDIISLMHREVVPAIGCTEPVAVALCVAKATELLGTVPERLELRLSGNILKNAMGVGIPGTGMIGLPIAVALGALVGRSSYGLEVLKEVTPDAVEKGRAYISEGRISIKLCEDAPSNLHIEVVASDNAGNTSEAVISGTHTNFVYLRVGNSVIKSDNPVTDGDENQERDRELDMRTVYDFAMTAPLEEIRFILESRSLNKAAAELALDGGYGHSLGYAVRSHGRKYFGDSPLAHIISYTSAACDARMGGAPVAVMSNSGSGNQGICATMPVVSFAEDVHAGEEDTIRALVLSHLT
ncbi:MAG: L-serine ammonia-lyase, iron-sulfur-dependent, subunit alpha, partial [Muribaculaceae bacterium]|nr:L-serine ammonia-lyase, iron-sulfur-dependent, subunit alpha [Muribaculaceae bacterium]